MDSDIVAVTRHNPKTHESLVLVAFTAFSHPDQNAGDYQRGIKPLRVEGVVDEVVFEATLSHGNIQCVQNACIFYVMMGYSYIFIALFSS